MKKLTVGIVAHVDAGKTTCIESILYTTKAIRKLGRVDHQDTVMDYDDQERNRGITIYSKEGNCIYKENQFYLIDTPGHVDFSSEMERCLQILDLAVLIINGQDGVQSHTETIWKCLEHYHIPVVVFVNKMDISYLSLEQLLNDLKKKCSPNCYAYQEDDFLENISLSSEEMLNEYLEHGIIRDELLQTAFYERKFFPVLFGSALKMTNIDGLLDLLSLLTPQKEYPSTFGARVYKISQDEKGDRLTHIKMTGGTLKTKEKINEEEKVDQIRIYQGNQYTAVNEIEAGDVAILKGVNSLEAGAGLGFEQDSEKPLLNAFMTYELILPSGVNTLAMKDVLTKIAEEDPQLELNIDDQSQKITIQIMGDMQKEILQKKIFDLSGVEVGFGVGNIVYLETIASEVDGAGHFEPLRHYAEVHVHLEPLEAGSGIQVNSICSTDSLNYVWQRSILNVLQKSRHRGVLTGSLLTDVKITLVAGKGSMKHTSGGDFRQAATRAVRQALMKAENILLEPYYQYELVLPSSSLSKALYDLETRNASTVIEDQMDGTVKITGLGPVRTLTNYQSEVFAYTKGTGRFTCALHGYQPTKIQQQLIEQFHYDPTTDLRNPCGSVFCANGAGYYVPWDEADNHMHIQLSQEKSKSTYRHEKVKVSNDDLQSILKSAGSNNRNTSKQASVKKKKVEEVVKVVAKPKLPKLLIVDGYNMVYSWGELDEIARVDLYNARHKLIDILANYQAYTKEKMIVVFDGYKRKDNQGTTLQKGKLTIVYTKTDETADAWIERQIREYSKKYAVEVATSDALIQNAVFAKGALRISAGELKNMIDLSLIQIQEKMENI